MMIIWALVFGMSLNLYGAGHLDMGAQVKEVFRTEADCVEAKNKLDEGTREAVARGMLPPDINLIGAVCVPVNLSIVNKRKTTGT